MEQYHPTTKPARYAEVILPLAVQGAYTYEVPAELLPQLQVGVRVEVEFGKGRLYSGLVYRLHEEKPDFATKPVLAVLDEAPIVNDTALRFWEWMAEYYCCTLGEVMDAALPPHLKLSSERRLTFNENYGDDLSGLDDREYLIAEALQIQKTITIEDARQILGQRTVMPVIKRLMDRGLLDIYEELKDKYVPKKVGCVRLAEPFRRQPDLLQEAFELCSRAPRQTEVLMAYVQLCREAGLPLQSSRGLLRQQLYERAGADSSILRAMEQKGILELFEREVSRLAGREEETVTTEALSAQQAEALALIDEAFKEKNVVLLHGVTGSGKTRLYVELIGRMLEAGKQVLYLLPEVALTTQIVDRLRKVFGNRIAVYHHRVGFNERVEVWQEVLNPRVPTDDKPTVGLVLGARSAALLPFHNLGLVIIDEEHDPSYKQKDPAPRYHGRDAAIYLAHLHGAKTLLGTATPSVESYFNARSGKYGLVELNERFGGVELPEIVLVDLRKEARERKLQSHFSSVLLEALQEALARKEQAILFKNRRGFAPTLRCPTCNWHAECINCDVSLTYHKIRNNLQCHYCGYSIPLPTHCPACGQAGLRLEGYGTQKVEDELKIYLPEARIGRLDYDAAKGKDAYTRIINDFEERRIDILVGTQMVTKGLDFENVGVVGVLSADHILRFPDFRAAERGFQLIVQVAGRAGRKDKRGKVIVQAMDVQHPVLREILEHDFQAFYQREILERKAFGYPPFTRLIKITLQHRKPERVNQAGRIVASHLRAQLGNRLLGPAIPPIGRVRNYYLLDLLIKMERNPKLWQQTKRLIRQAIDLTLQDVGLSTTRIHVDVDPVD